MDSDKSASLTRNRVANAPSSCSSVVALLSTTVCHNESLTSELPRISSSLSPPMSCSSVFASHSSLNFATRSPAKNHTRITTDHIQTIIPNQQRNAGLDRARLTLIMPRKSPAAVIHVTRRAILIVVPDSGVGYGRRGLQGPQRDIGAVPGLAHPCHEEPSQIPACSPRSCRSVDGAPARPPRSLHSLSWHVQPLDVGTSWPHARNR